MTNPYAPSRASTDVERDDRVRQMRIQGLVLLLIGSIAGFVALWFIFSAFDLRRAFPDLTDRGPYADPDWPKTQMQWFVIWIGGASVLAILLLIAGYRRFAYARTKYRALTNT
ncbi:hypothetical protein K227x_32530 [Rubripirellula lacrimiformis]|uniref:Uncharacterized protein n=2 Tax=Pirellulaceae TaxID=2691357 RepID=Q7UUR2_RHOBA|nr:MULTISPECIES: hypothetical protein [Pirellulaceae]QDT04856.1 hypothetical protein K227x_32530 [Rubripirellula lacrimiformis]CAD73015.1 hypothetical protein-transmembrane prediction [Rhodopirellula baltica SH 1]